MCLIAWNWQPASPTPLLLIANRDEYYARPTLPLNEWADAPILAGRDLQAGGTWLGVSQSGRLATLTNHRDPASVRAEAASRGFSQTAFIFWNKALMPRAISASGNSPFLLGAYAKA